MARFFFVKKYFSNSFSMNFKDSFRKSGRMFDSVFKMLDFLGVKRMKNMQEKDALLASKFDYFDDFDDCIMIFDAKSIMFDALKMHIQSWIFDALRLKRAHLCMFKTRYSPLYGEREAVYRNINARAHLCSIF